MDKLFALVDCNNYYASCERVFNPGLENKPVIVLSNNDGCVVARSNEVKALGIKMGTPVFKIKNIIEKEKITVFSSNYALYGDMSQRVMATLSQFTPNIEIYSIDEAFLDFSGFEYRNLVNYAQQIRKTVLQWTGIPVSIGVGQTKTLAKIAVHIAKKNKQCKNVFFINTSSDIKKHLKNISVEDIWGIGRRYSVKLSQSFGIKNALQLRDADERLIKKNFGGVVGLRIVKELQGTSCISLESVRASKKEITTSRSFSPAVIEFEQLREAISTFTATAAEKLRKQKSTTRVITVFILTNRFDIKNFYYKHKLIELSAHTNDTTTLISYAIKGLKEIFKKGYKYKKAGIMFTDIVPDKQVQLNLFAQENLGKSNDLMNVLDKINLNIGPGTVKFASEGLQKTWKMKAEKRSPRYTTHWDELLVVSA